MFFRSVVKAGSNSGSGFFCVQFYVVRNGFLQLWNQICALKTFLLCQQKHDFQL